MRLLLSARRGGCAFAEHPSVSSMHDEVPRHCLGRCPRIPSCALDAMTNAPAQVTDEGVLQRTVPYVIQTQQKSAEPAENPPALAAAFCHHPSSFNSDTPRER